MQFINNYHYTNGILHQNASITTES